MLILFSDEMSGTSWGCEGVFLWCYGCVCMFVMWQEVVTSGRVLSDDGSWRNHVWDESGMGVGEEEIKKDAKERKRGALHNKQSSLPPPASHSPTVGDIDPGGAVNGRAAWKVSAVSIAREANPLVPQAQWVCHNLGAAETNAAAALITPPSPCHTHAVYPCISFWGYRHDLGLMIGPSTSAKESMPHFYLQRSSAPKSV